MSDKDRSVAKFLGNEIPEHPPQDAITSELIELYFYIARSRRNNQCMSGVQFMPLTVRDITEVVEVHDAPISRENLDPLIFEMDSMHLVYIAKQQAKK